ncbi:phage holin [Mammaliicoccus sciuri]|uniref:phage holin n=1 Tax=Mammaliicoccus sciuri TaxID=1296 RepID=UPI0034DD7F96
MKINWKVRIKQKSFWVAIISAILLFAQQVSGVFEYDIMVYTDQITNIVNSVLGVLVLLGVVQDPTTRGIKDSEQAQKYHQPK